MIIDYNFKGKRITLVGGGHETALKLRSFVAAGGRVRLVALKVDEESRNVASELHVPLVLCRSGVLVREAFASADVVAVVSDDPNLGRRLRPVATRRRVLFYSADDPEASDWIQPAVRRSGPIEVAVSTGGRSPIVALALAVRLVGSVRRQDRDEAEVQAYARALARARIPDRAARRRVLLRVHRDPRVRAALVDGDLPVARREARRLVLNAVPRSLTPPLR